MIFKVRAAGGTNPPGPVAFASNAFDDDDGKVGAARG
jgi:hypothetical protein